MQDVKKGKEKIEILILLSSLCLEGERNCIEVRMLKDISSAVFFILMYG